MSAESGVLRAALTLLILAGVSAALLRGIESLSAPRAAANADRARAQRLARVLSHVRYDNRPHTDVLEAGIEMGGSVVHRVFRARRGAGAAAAVIEVSSLEGYSGSIRLLMAVSPPGVVLGVELLRHRETPGLGDRMEPGRSDWLAGFAGRSLGRPVIAQWRVRGDGGEFDAMTGATVTSRAVTAAIAQGLAFHARYRSLLYDGAFLSEPPDAK